MNVCDVSVVIRRTTEQHSYDVHSILSLSKLFVQQRLLSSMIALI